MRFAVIMAGGSGERFWPLSRRTRPKQILPLTGEKTMLAQTVERADAVVGLENVYIVAGSMLTPRIRAGLEGIPERNFLTEPEGRNTAPCLAFAAAVLAARYGDEASMCVLTADHLIRNVEVFSQNADLAFECAEKNDMLMTVGIQPTHANTGFGYLEMGASLQEDERGGARRVLSFREKPDEATARQYVESGDFLWNSGMFFWRIGTLIEAFRLHCPEIHEGIGKIRDATDTERFQEVLEATFKTWPSESIDYAVMEKAGNVGAVASRFDWDDVGTWTALGRIHPLDAENNLLVGDCVAVDSRNCIVHNQPLDSLGPDSREKNRSEKPLIAMLGVEDLIVVASDGAFLVCHRDREQDIKKLLKTLRERGHEERL